MTRISFAGTGPAKLDISESFGCLEQGCDGTPVPGCPVVLCYRHLAEVMGFLRENLRADVPVVPKAVLRTALTGRDDDSPADGVVYFIRLNNLVKIGKTRNLKTRVSSFSHPEIEVLASEPGYTDLENDLHRRFRAHRVRGDWFRPHTDIMNYIDEVRLRTNT